MIINGNRLLTEDGMVLTNGEVYSKDVTLGKFDSVENWQEVPESEQEHI